MIFAKRANTTLHFFSLTNQSSVKNPTFQCFSDAPLHIKRITQERDKKCRFCEQVKR